MPFAFESRACPGQVQRTVGLLGMVGEAGYSAIIVLKPTMDSLHCPIQCRPPSCVLSVAPSCMNSIKISNNWNGKPWARRQRAMIHAGSSPSLTAGRMYTDATINLTPRIAVMTPTTSRHCLQMSRGTIQVGGKRLSTSTTAWPLASGEGDCLSLPRLPLLSLTIVGHE